MPTRDEMSTHAAIQEMGRQARNRSVIAGRAQKITEYHVLMGAKLTTDAMKARREELRSELWPEEGE